MGEGPAEEGPDGSGGPAGEDVAGPVHAEVNAADADEEGQQGGGEKEESLEETAFVSAGEEGSEGQVGDGGEHGVAAGEAGGGDVDGDGDEVGPGSLEEVLQESAEEQAADDGTGGEEGHGAAAVEGKKCADAGGEQGEDGDAAEGGDVAGAFLQPGGAEGGEVDGAAHGEKDGLVKFAGAAVDDLVGQFGEEGDAEEDGGSGEEDAAFVAAEPGEEAEKRITCVHDYYGSMSRIRLIWLAALLALCGSVAYLVAGSGKGMPRAGEVAPLFEGVDQNGARVRLGDFRGKSTVVLYFYPKDGTPGCTAQACSLRDGYKAIQAAGAVVIGVSADTAESHTAFAAKHQLPFSILADPGHELIRLYGVGMPLIGISRRVTFVIGRDGVIRDVIRDARTRDHDRQVLESLK